MLWYFKNETAYEYPSNKIIENSLTQRFHKSVYEDSNEMELWYALQYVKDNSIPALSVIFPIKDLSVNYGNENDINKTFCDNNHIHYRYENRSGGCIVSFPGNILTLDIYPTDNFIRQHTFMNDFTTYLCNMDINATTNNNDLLIDNKKIIGSISQNLPKPYDKYVYFALAISINSDADLIDKICAKPMNKIPGALSDYNITTEETMDWILNWFNQHQYENNSID